MEKEREGGREVVGEGRQEEKRMRDVGEREIGAGRRRERMEKEDKRDRLKERKDGKKP